MPNSLRLAALPALLVLLQAGLTGCGTIQEDANTHHEAVRWGYWEAVVELMHADARKDLDLTALKNVRVTGYEVVGPSEITPEGKSLRLARIDYVLAGAGPPGLALGRHAQGLAAAQRPAGVL